MEWSGRDTDLFYRDDRFYKTKGLFGFARCLFSKTRFFSFQRTIDLKTIFPNLDVNGPVQKNLITDTLFLFYPIDHLVWVQLAAYLFTRACWSNMYKI